MNLNEVVCEVVQGGRSSVVPQFARKTIREAGISPHLGSHGPVLALDVACRNVLWRWVSGHMANVNPDALRGRIAPLVVQRGAHRRAGTLAEFDARFAGLGC